MDNDITYKTILNSINNLNKIFDDMACEACSTKFTLFKRKVSNFLFFIIITVIYFLFLIILTGQLDCKK